MSKIKRITALLTALFLAIFFFKLITQLGSKSKGPLENIINKSQALIETNSSSLNLSLDSVRHLKRTTFIKNFSFRNPKKILIGTSSVSDKNFIYDIKEKDQTYGVKPHLIQIYQAWGSNTEHQFQTDWLNKIIEAGSIPLITWEPWVSSFSDSILQRNPLAKKEKYPLQLICSGIFDDFIIQWAKAAKKFKHPIYLRFAHEMNDPYRYPWGPHNNKKGEFIAAWRHVHNLFDSVGAKNIIWIWSIHSAYTNYVDFFPGEKYIDIVGTGVLNFGSSVYWSKWWTFDELFGQKYNLLTAFGKPIFIVEFGSLSVGGSKSKWFSTAFSEFENKYPLVKGLIFFDIKSDQTITDKAVSWHIEPKSNLSSLLSSILTDLQKKKIIY